MFFVRMKARLSTIPRRRSPQWLALCSSRTWAGEPHGTKRRSAHQTRMIAAFRASFEGLL